jgi:hypothetical protein
MVEWCGAVWTVRMTIHHREGDAREETIPMPGPRAEVGGRVIAEACGAKSSVATKP